MPLSSQANGLDQLSDEKLIAELQKRLKRKPVIELKDYFANPDIDKYFEEIYNRHKKRIEYFCSKFVHDKDLLPDLFHDIFIKLYLNIHRYKPTKSFMAWMYRIAHNNCINYVQKNQNKELAVLNKKIGDANQTEAIELLDSEEKSILNIIIKEDMQGEIEKAIQKLPYEYINVYLLKVKAGLTFEEASGILKMSSRSLKTIYHNCLQFIKQELKSKNYQIGDG